MPDRQRLGHRVLITCRFTSFVYFYLTIRGPREQGVRPGVNPAAFKINLGMLLPTVKLRLATLNDAARTTQLERDDPGETIIVQVYVPHFHLVQTTYIQNETQ